MASRFFNRGLAGGAMLDIGVCALSLARLFLDSNPGEVKPFARKAPAGVDGSAAIAMMNREGQLVTAALSLRSRQPKRAVVSCEKGYIEIMECPRADTALIVGAVTGAAEAVRAGSYRRRPAVRAGGHGSGGPGEGICCCPIRWT